MKKHLGKALAMAVMMSVLAGGSAYAGEGYVSVGPVLDTWASASKGLVQVFDKDSGGDQSRLTATGLSFYEADEGIPSITLSTSLGLSMKNFDVAAKDITATGTIKAGTSGEIKSGETGLVNGGAVYTALQGKQDKLTETQLANLNADHSKYLTEHQDISGKADKADTLAGYGITDGATKTELADEAKAREDGDADTLKKANDYTDQEIAKISGGASTEALEKLDNKINQTNDRVDRVGATAAALAGIHYQPMAKGQSQVAVGMGGYKGKKATALGLAYQFNDRISGSVAGAANGSEHMFNVGFNYLFGQHSAKDIAQCAVTPGSMSLKEAEMQATIDSQGAKINTLESEVAELKAMVKALAAK